MASNQAKRGGEIGVNGEFYKGGEFLPSSEKTVKGQVKKSPRAGKVKKQEVAPYCWQVSPAPTARSIWGIISSFVEFSGKTDYSKETGKTGVVVLLKDRLISFGESMGWKDTPEDWINEYQSYANLWNSGERWILDWYE